MEGDHRSQLVAQAAELAEEEACMEGAGLERRPGKNQRRAPTSAATPLPTALSPVPTPSCPTTAHPHPAAPPVVGHTQTLPSPTQQYKPHPPFFHRKLSQALLLGTRIVTPAQQKWAVQQARRRIIGWATWERGCWSLQLFPAARPPRCTGPAAPWPQACPPAHLSRGLAACLSSQLGRGPASSATCLRPLSHP